MRILISLSANKGWHLTRIGELEYLTLSSMPPKDFTFKGISKVPYVEINRRMVWNKGTDVEGTKPTLQYLYVPARHRGKSLGKVLLRETLDYMKHSGIGYLVFDNFDRWYWDSAKRMYPNNVEFPKRYKKRLGIVLLDGENVANVLE